MRIALLRSSRGFTLPEDATFSIGDELKFPDGPAAPLQLFTHNKFTEKEVLACLIRLALGEKRVKKLCVEHEDPRDANRKIIDVDSDDETLEVSAAFPSPYTGLPPDEFIETVLDVITLDPCHDIDEVCVSITMSYPTNFTPPLSGHYLTRFLEAVADRPISFAFRGPLQPADFPPSVETLPTSPRRLKGVFLYNTAHTPTHQFEGIVHALHALGLQAESLHVGGFGGTAETKSAFDGRLSIDPVLLWKMRFVFEHVHSICLIDWRRIAPTFMDALCAAIPSVSKLKRFNAHCVLCHDKATRMLTPRSRERMNVLRTSRSLTDAVIFPEDDYSLEGFRELAALVERNRASQSQLPEKSSG